MATKRPNAQHRSMSTSTRRPWPRAAKRASPSAATSRPSSPPGRGAAGGGPRSLHRQAARPRSTTQLADGRAADPAAPAAGEEDLEDELARAATVRGHGRPREAVREGGQGLRRAQGHRLQHLARRRGERRRAPEGRHRPLAQPERRPACRPCSGGPGRRSRRAEQRPAAARAPSVDPSSASQARSGWGMRPTTLPASLQMPAMSSTEPLGLSV